jgi:hypothetical protein
MADVTENDLRAAIRALTDVVAPSVDATDALATEQLRLVVDYLRFLQSRLDVLYDRDRLELQQHLKMARALMALEAPIGRGLAARCQRAMAAGADSLNKTGEPMPALKAATAELAAVVREVVRESQAMEGAIRQRIEFTVLECSEERTRFERSWYLPLGFDPARGEVEPLSTLLGAGHG